MQGYEIIDMSEDFDSKRRQRFLGEDYFKWRLSLLDEGITYWSENTAPTGSTENERKALTQRYLVSDIYRRFLLMYTGGADIERMRSELEPVIDAYGRYTKAQRLNRQDANEPPLVFEEIAEYETVMQLIGFCYLLHRRDLLPRIVEMFDPAYRGKDTLYEDLLAYELEGRINVDSWYHDVPYRPLVFSLYRETKSESVDDLTEYLDAWYRGMAAAPWHDGHLDAQKNGKGTYVGYWAVEAAAVAFLLQLDDSSFRDHLLYPKDLADFARSFDLSRESAPAFQGGAATTVRTGQTCPETGIWKAQGHNVPGVMVQQGERMPEVFAPDRSGAYRSQPALWEFERKA
ncbi:PoNe immunity protein domain-containing protein [Burkholderia pseudomultivorans]|nr:PoNe immunity protein domain-containing protein [Burkholderia pseudomultivorans]